MRLTTQVSGIGSHELKAHGWANSITTTFSSENHLANWTQISYGDSLGWGNQSLFKWSWLYDKDDNHTHTHKATHS